MESLRQFEEKVGGVKNAIKVLGVSQASYYDYRNGRISEPPQYVVNSIEAHLGLSKKTLKGLVEKRAAA